MIWSLHNTVFAMLYTDTVSEIELISQLEYKKEELTEAWAIISNLIGLIDKKLPAKDIKEIRKQMKKRAKGECWINEY